MIEIGASNDEGFVAERWSKTRDLTLSGSELTISGFVWFTSSENSLIRR